MILQRYASTWDTPRKLFFLFFFLIEKEEEMKEELGS